MMRCRIRIWILKIGIPYQLFKWNKLLVFFLWHAGYCEVISTPADIYKSWSIVYPSAEMWSKNAKHSIIKCYARRIAWPWSSFRYKLDFLFFFFFQLSKICKIIWMSAQITTSIAIQITTRLKLCLIMHCYII